MKKEIERMKMVLNNLKQKLKDNQILCSKVAELIDLIVETDIMIEKLNLVDSHLLVVKRRIKNMIRELDEDKKSQTEETITLIKKELLLDDNNEVYIEKIRKTIEYCIQNYEVYQQTNYYYQYHTQVENSEISLLELLLL